MAEVIKKATRESYGEALTELADKYPDLIVLDADLAAATKQEYLKRLIRKDFLIAELQRQI